MAVYTDVGAEELSAFLAAYDLGAPLSFKGIAEGVENSNFFLRTEKGSFFLTLYEKRVAAGDLPFFIGLLDHLAAKGLNVPRPVPARDGQVIAALNGRPAAIVTFLDGVSIKRPEAAHCAALGALMARLHLAVADFPLTRANALSHEGWANLATALGAKADTIQPGLAAMIAAERAALKTNWPEGLARGVIHADLFPDNVFFIGPALSGVFDFYFACMDFFAYDLAIALNAWCFETDGSFNVTKGRALIAAYQQIRPLPRAEQDALPALARGAALRFLLTRAYDAVHHNPQALVRPKNPLDYVARLRFHQAAASASAYGLA